ncbi:MAG: hypothetical protein ACK5MD_05940 [Flavobacteriales bacterium]
MKQIVPSYLLLLILMTSCQSQEEKNKTVEIVSTEKNSTPYSDLVLYDNFDNELVLDTID